MAILKYAKLIEERNYDVEPDPDDHEYRISMNPKGKSSKYLKEIIIPELKARSHYYYDKWSAIKKNNETISQTKKQLKQKYNKEKQKIRRYEYGIQQADINMRAMEMYYDMMKIKALDSANYLDGYIHYRSIETVLKRLTEIGITRSQFDVLFLVYCHKYFIAKYGQAFGYSPTRLRVQLELLEKKGFVEKFKSRYKMVCYIISDKSNGIFKEMVKQQRADAKILYKALDDRQPKRTGWNYAHYDRKRVADIKDIYEKTDIHEFDKGTK